jgi:hypothetical protein
MLSPSSYHFILLRSKYSLQQPVLKHLSLCSSLNVRDQVSHSCRAIDNIIVPCILIFTFLHSRLNGSQHWPNSISSLFPPESNFHLLLSFHVSELCHIFKALLTIFISWFRPAFWWRDRRMNLISLRLLLEQALYWRPLYEYVFCVFCYSSYAIFRQIYIISIDQQLMCPI